MIPETFRKSSTHRKLWATYEFLSERDPIGPITKSVIDREVVKRAVDRRRTILEHRAADTLKAYFREERAHVVRAVGAGRDVGPALKSLEYDLEDTYKWVWGDSAKSWGRWAAEHVRRSIEKAKKRPAAYDFGAPVDAWLLENAGKRITGITESSRKKISAQIAQGTAAGETLKQIARRIDKFYLEDIIPNRSMVIARTEVGSAVNWSQHYVAADSGVEMEKEWLALNDDRTRDDHSEADGQRVGLDEPFEVGDDLLMYPGDPSGSPEEIINCRCSVLHHVVDDSGKAKSAAPGAPTVDAFARQVVNVEGADIITALAFARGVFGEDDDWIQARRMLMKRVHHLRRSAVEKYSPDQPRDEAGRWTDGGGDFSRTPENARRAETARDYGNGVIVRYTGGSKAAINPGEHVTVRGVYGMSDKTGVVYYNVEAGGGRRFTLAATTLRMPRPEDVPAVPADRKIAPRRPQAPSPQPPVQGPLVPPTESAPFSNDATSERIGVRLSARTGLRVDLKLLNRDSAILAAEEMDRVAKKYPGLMPRGGFYEATKERAIGWSSRRRWGNAYAVSFEGKGIRLRPSFFNKGDDNPALRSMVSIGWHPPGCTSLKDIVTHEFGHQMHDLLRKNYFVEFTRFLHTNLAGLKAVSTYAGRKQEYIAEAFSQIEAKESGRYTGPLQPGAEALRKFLADTGAGREKRA